MRRNPSIPKPIGRRSLAYSHVKITAKARVRQFPGKSVTLRNNHPPLRIEDDDVDPWRAAKWEKCFAVG